VVVLVVFLRAVMMKYLFSSSGAPLHRSATLLTTHL